MTATTDASTSERAAGARRRLPGVEGVWVLIAGDMMIFALLFGSFMHARCADVAAFETARHVLSFRRGGVNTLFLLTSSWCVVMSLRSVRDNHLEAALRWLGAGILGGAGFTVSKVLEYAHEISAGHTAGSGDFLMYYFMITGIHLVHVLAGTLVLSIFWTRWRRSGLPSSTAGFESAAAFWHMVDLLWIVLFPLLYLIR